MASIEQLWNWLNQQNTVPERDTEDFDHWLKLEDALSFLMRSAVGLVPIYILADHFYLYSLLVPEKELAENYAEDIIGWNFAASQGWGYGYSYKDGVENKQIFPPLDYTDSRILDNGEPILFRRHFDGYEEGQETYFELNQRMAHILNVHWIDRRRAYCKLDALGDLKNVVEIFDRDGGRLSVIDFEELELYMFLTDTALIRVFDVTRYEDHPRFGNPASEDRVQLEDASELHARRVFTSNNQSYLRGFQIIRRRTTDEIMMRVVNGKERQLSQYATFIAHDWKNKIVTECSCAPDQLGNYFEESDLPFEISPAFFRPEVILRYKQNPEKYIIEERTITCRGIWYLDYDINEAGQVHAYLRDLGNLPYEEQLYWKSFNEAPKTEISARAL